MEVFQSYSKLNENNIELLKFYCIVRKAKFNELIYMYIFNFKSIIIIIRRRRKEKVSMQMKEELHKNKNVCTKKIKDG